MPNYSSGSSSMAKIRLGMRLPVSMQDFWSFRSEKCKDDQSSDDGSPRSVLPTHGGLSPLCSAEANFCLRVSCERGSGQVHPSVDVCNSPINHKAMDIPHPVVASPRRRVQQKKSKKPSSYKFQSFEQYVSSYAPVEKQIASPSRSDYESDDSFGFDHSNSCSSDSEEDLKELLAGKQEMLPTDWGRKVRESIPVRKLSVDPYTDYRESMLEMIKEKGLGSLEDLEELLQCYLVLNPFEFHDTIIQAFTDLCTQLSIIEAEEAMY